MHLDGGYRHGFHGVGKRNARMRISCGIEHDAVNLRKVRALDFVDERAFVVRLEKLDLHADFFRVLFDLFDKGIVRFFSVNFGLSYAQHIDIRSVQNKKLHNKTPFIFSTTSAISPSAGITASAHDL